MIKIINDTCEVLFIGNCDVNIHHGLQLPAFCYFTVALDVCYTINRKGNKSIFFSDKIDLLKKALILDRFNFKRDER